LSDGIFHDGAAAEFPEFRFGYPSLSKSKAGQTQQ